MPPARRGQAPRGGQPHPPGGAGSDASAFRYRARHPRHGPARLCRQGHIVERADRSIGSPGDPVHIVGSSIVATEATISDDPAVAAMGRPRTPCSGLGASVVDAREQRPPPRPPHHRARFRPPRAVASRQGEVLVGSRTDHGPSGDAAVPHPVARVQPHDA